MNDTDLILNLHGRIDSASLARAFSRAVEDVFEPENRTQPRFDQKRVRGERLRDAEGSVSDELIEAFFGNIPHYHHSTLAYRVPLAERTWASVALQMKRDPEEGDGDASLDFGAWKDWTDGASLTSGQILTADKVIAISVRVIEAVRPDTAYLYIAGEPSFAPSNFLRFHRDARFFAHDVRQILRIAQDGDREEDRDGFFEWMKGAARSVGATQAYEDLEKVALRAPLADSEWSHVLAMDGFDVRTVLAQCRRTSFTETAAGLTLHAEKPLRSFVDEPYAALVRRAIGDPTTKREGDE